MIFQTKIITGNKNPRARIAWAGGGLLFLAMVLMCVDAYRRYGFWMFGLSIVVLGVGAFLTKGDLDLIEVSEIELQMGVDEIRVGETVYPLGQVTDIVFQVEGYDGMVDVEGYGTGQRGSRYSGYQRLLNGMNNYLDFKIDGRKEEWQFYLGDPQQVQALGALFKELYARRIPFLERSVTNDRTFLFEPVTKRQWEDRMIEHGYL